PFLMRSSSFTASSSGPGWARRRSGSISFSITPSYKLAIASKDMPHRRPFGARGTVFASVPAPPFALPEFSLAMAGFSARTGQRKLATRTGTAANRMSFIRSSKGGFVPERAKTTRRGRASQARSAPLDGGNERKVIRLGVLFSPPSRMLGKIVLGRRLARHLVAAVLAVSPCAGCAASLENSGLTSSDVPYTGQEQQLFDDTFRAELFGVEHAAFPPE